MLLLPLQGVDVKGACQPTEPENKFRSPVSFLFSLCLALVLSLKLSSKKKKKKQKRCSVGQGSTALLTFRAPARFWPSQQRCEAIAAPQATGHCSNTASSQQRCEAATAPQATGHRSNTVRPQ
jgi:hypothetical protein